MCWKSASRSLGSKSSETCPLRKSGEGRCLQTIRTNNSPPKPGFFSYHGADMRSEIFTIAFGAGFVLLGRWLYRNPYRVFPGWGLLNPRNPKVQHIARAYAVLFIFIGVLASGAVISFRFLPGWVAVIISLVIAIVGAFLLRPALPEPVPGAASCAAPDAVTPTQPFFGKHWKGTLAIACAFTVVGAITVALFMDHSEVSQLAFARAQADSVVKQHLGTPLRRRLLTSGSIELSGSSGRADLAIPISGPNGKATLLPRRERVPASGPLRFCKWSSPKTMRGQT